MAASTLVVLALTCGPAPADTTAPTARTVHLYGDSVVRGYGFGTHNDSSFLNRIDLIAARLAAANGHPELRFVNAATQDFGVIWGAVSDGTIKPNDAIVFANAGPHFNDNRAYQRWLELVVFAATNRAGKAVRPSRRLYLTTTFDYSPAYPLSEYDKPLRDGRSVNAVVRQVARQQRTGLLDWNTRMDAARAALAPAGVKVVRHDGVHASVFGNVVLAVSLLRTEGVRITNVEPVVTALLVEHDRLVEMRLCPPFDRAKATSWVRRLVGQ